MSNSYPEFNPRKRLCVPGCPACIVAPSATRHDDPFSVSIESLLGIPEKEEEQATGLCVIAFAEVGLGDTCRVTNEKFDAEFPPQT